MKDHKFKYTPSLPEQCAVSFETNGSQGGDAGHGAYAALTFRNNGAGTMPDVNIKTRDGELQTISNMFTDIEWINVFVSGDWEAEGMAVALIGMARQMLNDDDLLRTFVEWEVQSDE